MLSTHSLHGTIYAMPTIRILPRQLVAQIAAGEVVERPASAVKELIENSLDAGATQIAITLEDAGTKKIIITDNGHGMNRENISLAAMEHATSKIESFDDLLSIGTLGFRGEALASIAAVSRLTILSKTANDKIGNQIVAEHGIIGEPMPAGSPTGTTVIVETLFAHTPARKKYLKTLPTEMRHIMDAITLAAIAHPEVSFTLTHNGKRILELPAEHARDARIRAVLGADIAQHLIPLARTSPHLAIEGYVGKPQIASTRKDMQFVFVNGRPVTNALVIDAVRAAYGSLIEPKAHPVCILFLTLPLESVDVNIHPRKETVDFKNGRAIAEVITRTVERELTKNDLTYTIRDESETSLTLRDRGMDGYTASALKHAVTPWKVNQATAEREAEILQIHNVYLLAETPSGMLLIDQHAAHERILYEQFKAAFVDAQGEHEVYTLPEALVCELPASTHAVLEEHLATLASLGFTIEHFGHRACKVRAVPTLFKGRDIVLLLRELLDALIDEVPTTALDTITERTIAFLACRSAIKAGDYLAPHERKNLLEKLSTCGTSYTCPHGRPTHIEISKSELHKMFKRI